MITLKEIVRRDPVIARVSSEECKFLSQVLSIVHLLAKSWLWKWVLPKDIRENKLRLRMLAAAFINAPEEGPGSLQTQLLRDMEKSKK